MPEISSVTSCDWPVQGLDGYKPYSKKKNLVNCGFGRWSCNPDCCIELVLSSLSRSGLFCLSEFFLSSVPEQTQPNCPFVLASFVGVYIPDTAQPLCDGHRSEFLVLLLCKYLRTSTFCSPLKSPVHILHTCKRHSVSVFGNAFCFTVRLFPRLWCYTVCRMKILQWLSCWFASGGQGYVLTLLLVLAFCVLSPRPHLSVFPRGRICSNFFTVATVWVWK